MNWLALDIGGANLKMADGKGFAETHPFAMWKESKRLTQYLRTLIAQSPAADHLVVTMTGELADCFESKGAGVAFILDAVEKAADRRHTRVYLSNGIMVTTQVAATRPIEAAAANWHALASFSTRYAKTETALLIDVGSTTCDVIPIQDGKVTASAHHDTDRLLTQELVYTGVERSPICAVVTEVPYRGKTCPVMQELFATTRDVYVVLGELKEDPLHTWTADSRPSTKANSRIRLGRMIGADGDSFHHRDAVSMAHAIAEVQAQRLAGAILHVASRLPSTPSTIVISGVGEFLIQGALEKVPFQSKVISLSQELGTHISRCAPAHALAVLAREASQR